jgi:hypothetical protein
MKFIRNIILLGMLALTSLVQAQIPARTHLVGGDYTQKTYDNMSEIFLRTKYAYFPLKNFSVGLHTNFNLNRTIEKYYVNGGINIKYYFPLKNDYLSVELFHTANYPIFAKQGSRQTFQDFVLSPAYSIKLKEHLLLELALPITFSKNYFPTQNNEVKEITGYSIGCTLGLQYFIFRKNGK